jgi:hypothetical protein
MSDSATCPTPFEGEIRRHFAGSISTGAERAMRVHLAGCASCQRYYERHLVLAELDPTLLSAEERIGVGLGVRHRPLAWRLPALVVAGAVAVLALGVAVPLVLRSGLGTEDGSGFAPRGQTAGQGDFVVYRIRSGEPPERAPRRIRRSDELAFAYTNAGGFARLLVFGVDDAGGVHWYHPEWTDEATTPVAIPIAKGPELHELPQAISHELGAGPLRLYAVFTNETLSVKEIESSLASDERGQPALLLPGVVVRVWALEVE